MKTYKVIFSSQSPINQIPDSQTIFGAICNIIKYTKGQSALDEYIASFQQDDPILIHSSMFLNHYLPMVKKGIFPLDLVNDIVFKTNNENKMSILEELKKYKKISMMSEEIFTEYFLDDNLNDLTPEILLDKEKFCVYNNTLMLNKSFYNLDYKQVLLTKNGFPEDDSTNKSLFYQTQTYYLKNTEFCIYIKTNWNLEKIKDIFKYFEYFGIGSRRTVGLNTFRLERIEEIHINSKNKMKLILSKYIPNEEIDYEKSYYSLDTKIYRASKDYADNVIIGQFTHILEGSCMMMNENKNYYGKVIKTKVSDKNIYHYAIGFVL